MENNIGISSDSESQQSNDFITNRTNQEKEVSTQESSPDTLKTAEENKNENKTEKTEDVLSSGDEYITDSSSDDIDIKQEEVKPKEEVVKILPRKEVKRKPIYLNGMKITIHKHSQRKRSHREIYACLLKKHVYITKMKVKKAYLNSRNEEVYCFRFLTLWTSFYYQLFLQV